MNVGTNFHVTMVNHKGKSFDQISILKTLPKCIEWASSKGALSHFTEEFLPSLVRDLDSFGFESASLRLDNNRDVIFYSIAKEKIHDVTGKIYSDRMMIEISASSHGLRQRRVNNTIIEKKAFGRSGKALEDHEVLKIVGHLKG